MNVNVCYEIANNLWERQLAPTTLTRDLGLCLTCEKGFTLIAKRSVTAGIKIAEAMIKKLATES